MATSYVVTGAACNVRFLDPASNEIAVATLYKDAPLPQNVEPANLEHLLNLGFVAEVGGSADVVRATDDDPDGDGGAPPKNANKDEWVAYRQAQGDADAASKTKEQLIADTYPDA